MNFLKITFPISGLKTWIFVPPLVAFFLAFFGVMGGITGAFLLLPFQFSILHYTTPGVSATNLLYNLFTIPPALLRYHREGRFHLPLTLAMLAGVVPGMFVGYLLRLNFFTSPGRFRVLIGGVLLYLSFRLWRDFRVSRTSFRPDRLFEVEFLSWNFRFLCFRFGPRLYRVSVPLVSGVSLLVGVVGGAYGIGGGAILSPFLISVLRLPVYVTAGATLATTFVASAAGVAFYLFGPGAGPDTRPDFLLAALFGLGGLAGAWWGSRLQRRVPERLIKGGLFVATALASLKYILAGIFSCLK